MSTFRSGFAAILGRPNVGKSTLLNALVGEKIAIVSNKPQTTRGRVLGVCEGDDWQIVFLDTPGLHSPRTKLGEFMVKSIHEALDGIDLLLFVVDASQFDNRDLTWMAPYAKRTIPKILVVNKADLVSKEALMLLLNTLHDVPFNDIVPISARKGLGVDELKRTLLQYLPEGPHYFPSDMVTDQPERLLCAEIIREKTLWFLEDEVPHGVGVEMQAITVLSDHLTEIHATIYCERPQHKGILIGHQGQMIEKIGTAARADIEKLLQKHVLLKLWVKVRVDWRNRHDDLKTLGYTSDA